MAENSILTDDSPEYRACKEAGKRLYAKMKDEGFELTGVGIGVSSDRKRPTIHIMLHHKPRSPRVPDNFEGFEVNIEVTGTLRALRPQP